MPYFDCKRCETRLYSAASMPRCTTCRAKLERTEPGRSTVPRASLRSKRRAVESLLRMRARSSG